MIVGVQPLGKWLACGCQYTWLTRWVLIRLRLAGGLLASLC
jgi:hypothetical protein